MTFQTTIESAGKTATGMEVPSKIVDSLHAGNRPAVVVTINGFSYPSTIATMGGRFMLPVSAERRVHAGVKAGDVVDVDVRLDDTVRKVNIPSDLARALDANKSARAFFNTLAYSHQLRHVLAIEQAKTEETRLRRIKKCVSMLVEGKK